MRTVVKKQKYEETASSSGNITSSNSENLLWDLGWALKPKRITTRFNQGQKDFLQECFRGKDKLTAQRVVKLMRTLTVDGQKKFKTNEYLSREQQVMSYFSRMTATKKDNSENPLTTDGAGNPTTKDDDEVDGNIIEENQIAEQEEMRDEIKHLANQDCVNELQPHSFYAVMYDKRFYIGRLSEDCGDNTFRMKFLHQRGLEEFAWPIRDDIDVVHQSSIFHGPVQLEGAGPFKIPLLLDIQEEYKMCCGN